MIRRVARALRWPYAVVIGFVVACVPHTNSPDAGVDAAITIPGDYCPKECAARALRGCVEPALAERCVPTCKLSLAHGGYVPCERCEAYQGRDGAPHLRCLP